MEQVPLDEEIVPDIYANRLLLSVYGIIGARDFGIKPERIRARIRVNVSHCDPWESNESTVSVTQIKPGPDYAFN